MTNDVGKIDVNNEIIKFEGATKGGEAQRFGVVAVQAMAGGVHGYRFY